MPSSSNISIVSLLLASSLLLAATSHGVLAQSATGTTGQPAAEQTVDPAMLQCSSTAVAISTDSCFQQLGNVFKSGSTSVDAILDNTSNVIRTLCSDTCNKSYRSALSTLADTCSPVVSELFADKVGCHAPSSGNLDTVKNIAKDTMVFGKDLLCLRDTKVQGDAQYCSVQWAQLVKKYKLVSVETISRPTRLVTQNNEINQLMNSLGKTYNSFGHMVVPTFNTEAWKNVPQNEVCTPCVQMQVSQSFIFSMQKLYPALSAVDPSVAEKLKSSIDQAVKSVNGKCGNGYATSSGDLVLGTASAQSELQGTSSAAGLSVQLGLLVASAIAVVAVAFGSAI